MPFPAVGMVLFDPFFGPKLSKEQWILGIGGHSISIHWYSVFAPESESHRITRTKAPGGPFQDQETLTIS